MQIIKRFFSAPLYPLWIALYMGVSLLAYNLGEIYAPFAVRAIFSGLAFAALLLLLFGKLYGDARRAALAAGIWVFLFFTYGHVQILFHVGRRLAWFWLAGMILPAAALFRWRVNLRGWTLAANLIWLFMLISPLNSAAQYFLQSRQILAEIRPPVGELRPGAERPDIYYFILDSYTRADTLQTIYGFDNSAFLDEMEALGFYVASCSQSNYNSTELSLSSSLNLDYLQTLDPSLKPKNQNKLPLWALIQNNAASRLLKDAGYETVAFATGFPWSELRGADQYFAPQVNFLQLNEFETLFLDTTLAQAFDIPYKQQEFERYRERTQEVFARLPQLAQREGAQFFFIHLLDPHPPFVFDENGAAPGAFVYTNSSGALADVIYPQGYLNEMRYLNRQLPALIRALQANSATPPVIIIQGDHGAWFQPPQYLSTILNLYLFPGHESALTPQFTPVNSFRLLFNEYLGGDFPLLPNIAYDSASSYYDFQPIPNPCK